MVRFSRFLMAPRVNGKCPAWQQHPPPQEFAKQVRTEHAKDTEEKAIVCFFLRVLRVLRANLPARQVISFLGNGNRRSLWFSFGRPESDMVFRGLKNAGERRGGHPPVREENAHCSIKSGDDQKRKRPLSQPAASLQGEFRAGSGRSAAETAEQFLKADERCLRCGRHPIRSAGPGFHQMKTGVAGRDLDATPDDLSFPKDHPGHGGLV